MASQPRIPQRFLPYMQQAQAEANVRYGPQVSALAELLQQAQGTYRQSMAQANAARQIIQAATQHAQGQLADPSNPITSLAAKAQGMPGTEGAIVAQNLGLTADAARTQLAQHYVQAADAQKYQGQAALSAYQSDAGKIGQQQLDLQGQYGNYITGRYDTQVSADRKQRHDANLAAKRIAASYVTAGVTPSGKVIPGGKADPSLNPSAQKSKAELDFFNQHGYFPPTGPPKAGKGSQPKVGAPGGPKYSQAQKVDARRQFNAGVQTAQQYNLAQGMPKNARSVSDITTILMNGVKNSSGKVVVKGVVKDPFLARAAAERYVYGYVLPATNRKLNKEYGIGARVQPGPKYVPPRMSASGPVGA